MTVGVGFFPFGIQIFDLNTKRNPVKAGELTSKAEAEGFEPSVPLLVQQFSRLLVSTAHARLRLAYQPFASLVHF